MAPAIIAASESLSATVDTVRAVGLLDRIRKRSSHDEQSIRETLQREGASSDQAHELVEMLGRRLSADEVHMWLCHPEKCHGIPDPESQERFGVTLNWTPVNAVAAHKADLVIDEARRFVAA